MMTDRFIPFVSSGKESPTVALYLCKIEMLGPKKLGAVTCAQDWLKPAIQQKGNLYLDEICFEALLIAAWPEAHGEQRIEFYVEPQFGVKIAPVQPEVEASHEPIISL